MLVFFLSFIVSGHIYFGNELSHFKDLAHSTQAVVLMLTQDPAITAAIFGNNPNTGMVFYFIFFLMIKIILIDIFISLVYLSYVQTKKAFED